MKYPRIGKIVKMPKEWTRRGLCKCGQKADYIIHVQHDIFRGNDSVHKVCKLHKENFKHQIAEQSND